MLFSRIGRYAAKHLNSSRSAFQRVEAVAGVITSTNSTELPIRSRSIDDTHLSAARAYATAATSAKPKTHTGRTTRKTTKKTTAKATPKSKTAVKKKPAQKSTKKAKAKPRVKRVKKVLTPEDKQKIKLKELKIKALVFPKTIPANAWNVLNSELTKQSSQSLAGSVKEASAKYKNLLPEEREHYNHVANENKAKNTAAFDAWVKSYTPEEIRIANNARAQLRRITKRARKWPAIKDDRQVKRPAPARLLFQKDRWASGDFKGMKLTDVPRLINREWEALPASQKKAYEDQHAESKARYAAERVRVYGENQRPQRRRPASDSTAASSQIQREAASAGA